MKHFYQVLFILFLYSLTYAQQPCPGLPTVDYGGKTYHTVAIGNQCWLKENLDVGTWINGSLDQTNNSIIEKYCYDDDTANCTIYGGLYLWAEVVGYTNGATNTTRANPPLTGNVQGICPKGWHLPKSSEFQTLCTAVNNDGNSLKAVGVGTGMGYGTNTSGFSALLAGLRLVFYDGNFHYLGYYGNFWSSTEYNPYLAYYTYLNPDINSIYLNGTYDKVNGLSVRCVNDLNVSTMPVELGLFTAIADGKTIQLGWETKTELNFNRFEIEHALVKTKDATMSWATAGTVKAAGTSTSTRKYSYSDKNLQSGKYQYRLKMIDNDGTFKYSNVVETEVAVPKNYELSQNYPNPFNPNTIIKYSLPVAANIKLTVYNTLGQVVKILDNGYKNAGTYTITFDASELTSGTYFYRLEAGQFTQVKKMMLVK
jgi:uncharacterized protein (TIGR02145 family)